MPNIKFKLGADPECQLLVGGVKTIPHEIMREALSDLPYSDMTEEHKTQFGGIGHDHNQVLEFRPKAGTVEKLTENIEGIFKTIGEKMPYCDLSTLSYHSCIGGHIHLEIPEELTNGLGHDNICEKDFIDLHKILSIFYLPIMMSENKPSWKKRLEDGGRYGEIVNENGSTNAYRISAKGKRSNDSPIYTFEFRTCSAEWTTTKQVCKATLAYIATVYNEYLNHSESFKSINSLAWKTHLQAKAMRDMVLAEHKLMTTLYLQEMAKTIRTFEFYNNYKAEIEYILKPQKVYKDKFKANYNPIQGWNARGKLNAYNVKAVKDLDFKFKTDRDVCKTPFDSLLVKSIIYNNDANVIQFAYGLANNVYQAKAMLAKDYFLFGIRKGITKPLVGIAKVVKAEESTRGLCDIHMVKGDIKTIGDMNASGRLFSKMYEKYINRVRMNNNFETKEVVIIGIPFNMREETDLLPIYRIVAQSEAGLLQPIKVKGKEIESGKIYDILTGPKPAQQPMTTKERVERWIPPGMRVEDATAMAFCEPNSDEETDREQDREEASCAE